MQFIPEFVIGKLFYDYISYLDNPFYSLLAYCNTGIGSLSNILADFNSIQNFRYCCRRSFWIIESDAYVAGEGIKAFIKMKLTILK